MTSCFSENLKLLVTRVCEDSRNWTSAVFAPEIYQVDPAPSSPMRLWSNPSHHHDPTPKSPSHHHGHVPSSGQLSSRQQAAQTASHHHRPPILEITKIEVIFLQTAQHHVHRPIISGISDQCYMFRLMTFEVLKLVNQFGLYLFLSIMKEIPFPPLWRDFLIPNDVNQFGLYLFPRYLIILKWMKKSYVSFTVSLVKL